MEESMHVGEQETSLQDQSYHTIRRKIVYLDYKPGEKLGVKQLCDDLDMGRTPVREALVRLAQEGLVRTVPQSGTYVSPINLTLAESACYIREHLEKQVIVECCARATSACMFSIFRRSAPIWVFSSAMSDSCRRLFVESNCWWYFFRYLMALG